MLSPVEALERLREGNRRFVEGGRATHLSLHPEGRAELVGGQAPFAIILGCSDSRVPAELVFDQGAGDLFVVRVAGNVVAPTQLGSIEFAAEKLGVRLVVVMGHSGCGAVSAALEARGGNAEGSPAMKAILDRLQPCLAGVPDDGVDAAVRANVVHSVADLRRGSDVLARLVAEERLQIIGAEYVLESGVVDFL